MRKQKIFYQNERGVLSREGIFLWKVTRDRRIRLNRDFYMLTIFSKKSQSVFETRIETN